MSSSPGGAEDFGRVAHGCDNVTQVEQQGVTEGDFAGDWLQLPSADEESDLGWCAVDEDRDRGGVGEGAFHDGGSMLEKNVPPLCVLCKPGWPIGSVHTIAVKAASVSL